VIKKVELISIVVSKDNEQRGYKDACNIKI